MGKDIWRYASGSGFVPRLHTGAVNHRAQNGLLTSVTAGNAVAGFSSVTLTV